MLMHCIQMVRNFEPSLAALQYCIVCLFGKWALANLQGWQQANWALHAVLQMPHALTCMG